MKNKIIGALLAVIFFAVCFSGKQYSASSPAGQITVSAEAAILVCADNGDVLFEKNADEKKAIASITKIMTAIIALEYAEKNDRVITFTEKMTAEGSSLYLKSGDKLRLSELVKGMLCVSGNDAANAVAVGIAGSKKKFAEMMNSKARELGMSNSHFVTPSGLDDENHYSTARDMSILCRYAMLNETFADIVSQKSLTVKYVFPEGKTQECSNHNRLLNEYEGCIGIKTGYTKKAGRTLTACAERNGVRLIAVTLCAPDDWNDHKMLFDYGFSVTESFDLRNVFQPLELPIVGGTADSIGVCPDTCFAAVFTDRSNDISYKIIMPHFCYAPVKKGTVVGEVHYYRSNKKIASALLCAAESVDLQEQYRR